MQPYDTAATCPTWTARCRPAATRARCVAHLFGANAFGYLDLGEAGSPTRRTLAPTFKRQDITITGALLTCAVRMGFQAMVIERNFGLNPAQIPVAPAMCVW